MTTTALTTPTITTN